MQTERIEYMLAFGYVYRLIVDYSLATNTELLCPKCQQKLRAPKILFITHFKHQKESLFSALSYKDNNNQISSIRKEYFKQKGFCLGCAATKINL